jgi:hypothetical protein
MPVIGWTEVTGVNLYSNGGIVLQQEREAAAEEYGKLDKDLGDYLYRLLQQEGSELRSPNELRPAFRKCSNSTNAYELSGSRYLAFKETGGKLAIKLVDRDRKNLFFFPERALITEVHYRMVIP